MNFIRVATLLLLWLASLVAVTSCSSGVGPLISGVDRGSAPSSSNGQGKSSLAENVPIVADFDPHADSGKASDDDEGIPGYFREISAVQVESIGDGQLVITAPVGTVNRVTTQIFLNIWYLDRSHFSENQLWIQTSGLKSAVQVGSVMANMDGGFRLEVSMPSNASSDAIVIAIDHHPQPMNLDFIVDDFAIFGGFSLENYQGSTPTKVNGLLTSHVERMETTLGIVKTAEILSQDFATSKEEKRRRHSGN